MTKELDKDRVRDLLNNWRAWARDCPPDPAEVDFYTVSPDFRDYVKPNPSGPPYDTEAAVMVEKVLREMFKIHPFERDILITYYLRSGTVEDVARMLGYSRPTMFRRLTAAHKVFGEMWFVCKKKLDMA